MLSTVLKDLPTPFGKVGKIESCHKFKFYSDSLCVMYFFKSLAKKTIYKILIYLRTLFHAADFDFAWFFVLFSNTTRTLTSLFTSGFRKSDLKPSVTILGPISRFHELTTDFSRFLEK